jgi:hypothetical protein
VKTFLQKLKKLRFTFPAVYFFLTLVSYFFSWFCGGGLDCLIPVIALQSPGAEIFGLFFGFSRGSFSPSSPFSLFLLPEMLFSFVFSMLMLYLIGWSIDLFVSNLNTNSKFGIIKALYYLFLGILIIFTLFKLVAFSVGRL